MGYQIPRQGSIGLQSRWHWDVYLDDADDFYFWFCEKISKISKNIEKYRKILKNIEYCSHRNIFTFDEKIWRYFPKMTQLFVFSIFFRKTKNKNHQHHRDKHPSGI